MDDLDHNLAKLHRTAERAVAAALHNRAVVEKQQSDPTMSEAIPPARPSIFASLIGGLAPLFGRRGTL
jgi:hypothetical protein